LYTFPCVGAWLNWVNVLLSIRERVPPSPHQAATSYAALTCHSVAACLSPCRPLYNRDLYRSCTPVTERNASRSIFSASNLPWLLWRLIMSTSGSDPLLPAFGIRDLHGPQVPPGIVQITSPQYESTIRSQPDAILTYIDEDDGEIISVGSGLELAQRLEDPVVETTTLIPGGGMTPSAGPFNGDQKMHVFDIQRTSGSLAVWRDHEAYSSKFLRALNKPPSASRGTAQSNTPSPPEGSVHQPGTFYHKVPNEVRGHYTCSRALCSSPDASSACSTAGMSDWSSRPATDSKISQTIPVLASPGRDPADSVQTAQEEGKPSSSERISEYQQELPDQLEKVLSNAFQGLEARLGGLADFLQTTADTIRAAAEKTHDTDTTPIENVLDGFKNILSEVGEFGLSLLATLDKGTGSDSTTDQRQSPRMPPSPDADAGKQTLAENIPSKRVSFANGFQSSDRKRYPLGELSRLIDEFAQSQCSALQEARSTGPASPSTRVSGASTEGILSSPCSVPPHSSSARGKNPVIPDTDSILDLEPADPDFSTRYPPLMSLRRVKTVGGLRDASNSSSSGPTMTTKSALTRYPSIGQLEKQSRSGAARTACDKPSFAGRRYHDKMMALRQEITGGTRDPQDRFVANMQANTVQDGDPQAKVQLAPTQTSAQTATASTKTAVALDHLDSNRGATAGVPHMGSTPDVPKSAVDSTQPLPGAWPEPKTEDSRSAPPPANRSSDPLFGYLFGSATPSESRKPARSDGPSVTTLVSRNSAPSDHLHRHTNLPRRSRTVPGSKPATAAPAARLAEPFDPFTASAPEPVSTSMSVLRPQQSNPDLAELSLIPDHRINEQQQPPVRYQPRRSHTLNHADRYQLRSGPESVDTRPTLWDNFNRAVPAPSPTPPGSSGPASNPFVTSAPLPPVPQFSRPIFNPGPFMGPRVPGKMRDGSTFTINPATHRQGRAGMVPPPPLASTKVDDCVRTLQRMGYGWNDPHEMSRLNVYAGVAAGDVAEAIETIEEDRKAAKELAGRERS